MKFWTNFAKNGSPGKSTNDVIWEPYQNINDISNYLVLDKKKKLRMVSNKVTFKSLVDQLIIDNRVNDLEKCVILLQMFTYVGNDMYEENIKNYPNQCSRSDSEKFLINNASFIEY